VSQTTARTLDLEGSLKPCGAGQTVGAGTAGQWPVYNAGFFAVNILGTPCLGCAGNLGRNSFVGPGNWAADMTLSKNFKITERVNMKFDANGFNVFNRANFILATAGGGAHNKYTIGKLRPGGWHSQRSQHAVRSEVQLLAGSAGRFEGLFLKRGTSPFSIDEGIFVGAVAMDRRLAFCGGSVFLTALAAQPNSLATKRIWKYHRERSDS
jgi:hypothetical protein